MLQSTPNPGAAAGSLPPQSECQIEAMMRELENLLKLRAASKEIPPRPVAQVRPVWRERSYR